MAELLAGRAFVDLIPKVSPGGAAAAEAETTALFSGIAGKAKLAGLAIGASLVAGTIGVGVGLFKLGDDFHSAFSRIRIDTGATGPALEGLEGSFKKVLSVRPDSMDDVAEAISKLKAKGDLTGPSLESMAVSELRLAKITKEDLGAQLDATTELFNNWGTAAADQPGKLDELFRASQATGTSVTDLAAAMASGGTLMRTAGLDFEQSAALVGLLQKSGIQTTAVMAPLSKAIASAAKEGKSAEDVLRSTFDAIRKAPDDTAAAGAAIDVFGARAGPRLAGLIREGKLGYDELAASIRSGGDTIAKAATDTSTLGGKFAVFRNKIRVALEPLATTVFDTLNDAAAVIMPKLGDAVATVADTLNDFIHGFTEGTDALGSSQTAAARWGAVVFEWFDRVRGIAVQLFDLVFRGDFTGGPLAEDSPIVAGALKIHDLIMAIVSAVKDNLGPVMIGLGVILGGLAVGALVAALTALVSAILSPVVAIAALVAGLIYAYQNFEGFRAVVDAVAAFLTDVVAPAVGEFVGYLSEQISNLAQWWRDHWAQIQEAVSTVVGVIRGIIEVAVAVISFIWQSFGDTILTYTRGAFEQIRATIEFVVGIVRGIIELALALITGDWSGAWEAIKGILSSTWDFITGTVGRALDLVKTFIGDGLETAKRIVSGALDSIVGYFLGLPGRLRDAAGDLFGFLGDLFRDAINSVIRIWNDFKIPSISLGWDAPGPLPDLSFDTPEFNFPDIPYLASGARILRRGLAVVGDDGPELLDLGLGAMVAPLTGSDRLGLFGTAGARGGFTVENLTVPTAVNATADEVVDAMDAKLGWKFSGRNDR